MKVSATCYTEASMKQHAKLWTYHVPVIEITLICHTLCINKEFNTWFHRHVFGTRIFFVARADSLQFAATRNSDCPKTDNQMWTKLRSKCEDGQSTVATRCNEVTP